jgi:fructose-1-phosphate kinase PfkB-like protein
VLIAGPNLSIDRTIGVERFDAGHIHRARRVEARVGGGGANAARIALQLDAPARLITIIPAADVRVVVQSLDHERVPHAWVRCRGRIRIATILHEEVGRVSVLSEPGARVDAREWEAFLRLARGRVRDGELLLCSGSLPPGAPADGYAYLARQARRARLGVRHRRRRGGARRGA